MKFLTPCFASVASENSISGLFNNLTQGLDVSWVRGLNLLAWPPTGIKHRIFPGSMLRYMLVKNLKFCFVNQAHEAGLRIDP